VVFSSGAQLVLYSLLTSLGEPIANYLSLVCVFRA